MRLTRLTQILIVTALLVVLLIGVPLLLFILRANGGASVSVQTLTVNSVVCGTWILYTNDNPTMQLNAISALSPNSMWAVGYRSHLFGSERPFIWYWNGSTWLEQASPPLPAGNAELNDVKAIAQDNVWAAGTIYNTSDDLQNNSAFILHWNGKEWGESLLPDVRPPGAQTTSATLSAIDGSGAADIWAAGDLDNHKTLLLHWDGKSWSKNRSSDPGTYQNVLLNISAKSADNVWAVGYQGSGNGSQTLVEHWDGSDWQDIPSPSIDVTNVDNEFNRLYSIDSIVPNEAWAVGATQIGRTDRTVILHWNGVEWTISSDSPTSNSGDIYGLDSITFSASNDGWALGSRGYYTEGHIYAEHWDGTSWSVFDSPNNASKQRFKDALVTSSSALWAVGYSGDNSTVAHFQKMPCGGINK